MSRWFRVYDELVDDPKVQCLPPELFKLLINLWCIASKNEGTLPALSHVAYTVRADEEHLLGSLEALERHGLLHRSSNQHGTSWAPHAWEKRQFKSDTSTPRVKRFRNVSSAVSETAPETETETETEKRVEKKERACARAEISSGWPPDYAEQFWQAFPNKIGRKDALQRLKRVAQSGTVDFLEMMGALYRYAGKTDDRPFCNPATWINQERWTDVPAVNGNGHVHHKLNASQQAERLAGLVRAREREGGNGGTSDFFGRDSAGRGDVEIIPPKRA